MVHCNPQTLQPMLQELGKQNPQLLRRIQENPAEFLQLVNEPFEGSDGDTVLFDQPGQEMPHAITVTPAEKEAIQRLEAMGFRRALVIEAFLACDRNELLAAIYLLDTSGDFEE